MKQNHVPVLVLGASGFLGAHLTAALLNHGWRVRGLDRHWDRARWQPHAACGALEIHEASVFDEEELRRALDGVSIVFDFLSFSVPSTSPTFLGHELDTTLRAMDRLLAAMVHTGVPRIVYPSSGGTIYGEGVGRPARETDPTAPLSSYGMGKLLCEEMIRFYGRIHGLQYLIVRPANPYGTSWLSRKTQGVIDVFLERVLTGQPLQVWGNINNVRDYVFIDDLIEALLTLVRLEDSCSRVVNIGTGQGASLREVIQSIAGAVGREPEWSVNPGAYAGVSSCVLDISQLRALADWKPRYSLDQGIREAWQRKLVFAQGNTPRDNARLGIRSEVQHA